MGVVEKGLGRVVENGLVGVVEKELGGVGARGRERLAARQGVPKKDGWRVPGEITGEVCGGGISGFVDSRIGCGGGGGFPVSGEA
jgi:hypothetical protein